MENFKNSLKTISQIGEQLNSITAKLISPELLHSMEKIQGLQMDIPKFDLSSIVTSLNIDTSKFSTETGRSVNVNYSSNYQTPDRADDGFYICNN